MAAYMGGGSGSGDTHVSRVMGNRSKPVAAKKAGGKAGSMLPSKGGTPGSATAATKSAGKAVTKATGAAKTKATKTGTSVPKTPTDASRRSGSGGKAGGQRQGGAGFPGNNS
jgi:hypothetical protein